MSIAAIIAPGQFELNDIQLAVLDQEVSGRYQNSGPDPRQKYSQIDDPSDYQNEHVIR